MATYAKIFLILNLFFLFNAPVFSQNIIKARFQKIEFATYDVNSPRIAQKDKVEINFYALIDHNGAADIQLKYIGEQEVRHATCQLPDSIVGSLNSIFDGMKKLKSYLNFENKNKGYHYAGYYDFVQYTYSDNDSDALCFVNPDVSHDFQKVLKMLEPFFYGTKSVKTSYTNIGDSTLSNNILSCHKRSKYLPIIELPPPAFN